MRFAKLVLPSFLVSTRLQRPANCLGNHLWYRILRQHSRGRDKQQGSQQWEGIHLLSLSLQTYKRCVKLFPTARKSFRASAERQTKLKFRLPSRGSYLVKHHIYADGVNNHNTNIEVPHLSILTANGTRQCPKFVL